MLNIHILDVGNGDSIVIEHIDENENKHYGVIDSNIKEGSTPPALTKLQELNASRLSFVSLTHPHWDHYTGLSEVIQFYKNNIHTFYSFPVGNFLHGRLEKLANIYKERYIEAGTEKKRRQFYEFVEIIILARNHIQHWEEPTGFMNPITPVGFDDVEFYVLLPTSRSKGKYFEMIESGSHEIVEVNNPAINKLSIAFYIKYKDNEVVLAGDGHHTCWNEHIRKCGTRWSLSSDAVKLPHHGSRHDNTVKILNHLYSSNERKQYAMISANGSKHPHQETLQRLSEKNIHPYCTNLSRFCGKATVPNREKFREIDPKVANMVINNLETQADILPCQGDICISIDNSGAINVTGQTGNACSFRGDFDFLIN